MKWKIIEKIKKYKRTGIMISLKENDEKCLKIKL